MTAAERSLPIAGTLDVGAALVKRAVTAGIQLQAQPGGKLWADRLDLLPPELRADLAAHRPAVLHALVQADAQRAVPAPPPGLQEASRAGAYRCENLPGVPPDWCEGVALLVSLPTLAAILPGRWAALAQTSQRLLHDHGAALHGAGWGTLDVWGLHPTAPAANPSGWGLAWLLWEHGDVLDIGPDVVGMRRGPGGARLAVRPRLWCERVPAWKLR